MPRYAYDCKDCGETFDVLHLSFSGAEEAEKAGIECPHCHKINTARNTVPSVSMRGGGFRRYGLWTYGGPGNY